MKRRQLLGALALFPASAFAQALPAPRHGKSGLIRIAGTPALAPVVAAWSREFLIQNPSLRIDANMTGSDVAMASLYTAKCDIALLGREATKPEIQAFEWIHRYRPRGLPILTGSVATPGCSPAVAVMVHPDNPMTSITLDQLRAAFGDEPPLARTWGDLGLGGQWSERPINLYAPEAESGTGRFFRARVLHESNRLVWSRMREFETPTGPMENDKASAMALRRALAHDPDGLAIGVAGTDNACRVLSVAGPDGQAHFPEPNSLLSDSYPLTRHAHAYVPVPTGEMLASASSALLRFALSKRGQSIATRESEYLALPYAAAARSQNLLLDFSSRQ